MALISTYTAFIHTPDML